MHNDPIMRRMHACVLAGVPCNLVGEPGTGKTARVKSYAKIRKLALERWLLSRAEPIDLKPRVHTDGKIMVLDPPEIERLVLVARQAKLGSAIVALLFLDELNRATREVEGAALDRIDAPPEGVAVVIACNPQSRGQAARSLESAAANRMCHLQVKADAVAWAAAQVNGWEDGEGDLPVPSAQAIARANARAGALVSAFIRRRDALLEVCPDNPVHAGGAWPSTRSWEHARNLHGMSMALSLDAEDTRSLIEGCIGEGAAIEYLTYVADADLPDPEDLLRDPSAYHPTRGRVDRTVAALTAVAGAVRDKFTDDRWCAAWEVLGVCTKADQADAAMVGGDLLVMAWKAFARRDAKGAAALTQPHVLMKKYAPRMANILGGS